MKNGKIEKWNGFPEEIYLESLVDDKMGMVLNVRGGKEEFSVRIIFENALLYQNIDESDYLEIADECWYVGQGLYELRETPLITWFHARSKGMHEGEEVIQYGLYTCDDCVEVLATEVPRIVF